MATLTTCEDCAFFFRIPEGDLDYEVGKGDCVLQRQDQKGKFWLSKPVYETQEACEEKQSSNR